MILDIPYQKTDPEDTWSANPKVKCLACGDVIQWKGEVSIVQCKCKYLGADSDGRILFSKRDQIIVCIE